MIDRKLGEKPLFFEISIGNAGNTIDGHNDSQCIEAADQSNNLRKYTLFILSVTKFFFNLIEREIHFYITGGSFINKGVSCWNEKCEHF